MASSQFPSVKLVKLTYTLSLAKVCYRDYHLICTLSFIFPLGRPRL